MKKAKRLISLAVGLSMLAGVSFVGCKNSANGGGLGSDFVYTSENLSLLVGKTVGVLQINNVPGLTFKAVLNKHGIAWQELTNTGSAAADKVNLIALPDASAVTSVDADCFVLAEPAATAQSRNGFSIVGDLQSLYSGENGYPQAALLAKTELVETCGAWLDDFTEKVSESATWLTSASGAEIVAAVNAHMDDSGMTTSLKAPLLTADVLGRCGVRFAYAADIQDEAQAFLSDLITVNAQATKLPNAAFYWTGTQDANESVPSREITVYMPDGAPALALAGLMHADQADDGMTYKVVDAALIASKTTYADATKNADLCVMPINAAAKLHGESGKYTMIGAVTHGNLYMIAK
ncbi:MAG: hypothetical protein IJX31_04910 [Clostridia bacterium]|nr:hypothetical protein [Clostridia bacterium]